MDSKRATHQVGEKVVVLYPPGNPGAARIRAFQTLWFFPAFFGVFGLVWSTVGAVGLVAIRRGYIHTSG